MSSRREVKCLAEAARGVLGARKNRRRLKTLRVFLCLLSVLFLPTLSDISSQVKATIPRCWDVQPAGEAFLRVAEEPRRWLTRDTGSARTSSVRPSQGAVWRGPLGSSG